MFGVNQRNFCWWRLGDGVK